MVHSTFADSYNCYVAAIGIGMSCSRSLKWREKESESNQNNSIIKGIMEYIKDNAKICANDVFNV